jgi:hypothetical protein
MKRFTLKFANLAVLSNCIYELGITKPPIDYKEITVIVDLTGEQVEYACLQWKAEVLKELSIQK